MPSGFGRRGAIIGEGGDMSNGNGSKAVKKLRKGGPRVFRSMAEFRAHFFPKEYQREQEREKVSDILDEAKYDRPRHKRHLAENEIEGINS
jgi:hypothetical protein